MSGIEVAGLVFGILPILVEVVKSYSTVADGLHTFRHYSREVKSISLKVNVQNGIFLNHCRLLLRLVEDEKVVEDMLEDGSDRRWTSKELNDKLNDVLRDSFELCCSIVEETKEVIDEIDEEMTTFNELKARKKMVCACLATLRRHTLISLLQDETFRATIKRLRGAIQITFNKSKYERWIADLRERNDDLSTIRAQVSAFQHQATSATGMLVRHRALPERFRSIQSASQKLHEALCSAWCCDDARHRGHHAKLCLEAEVRAEVRLDLAISCHETPSEGRKG
jgi:transposase